MMRLRIILAAIFALGFGGGSGGGSSSFTPYSPTGLASADTTWQNLLASQIGVIDNPALYGAIQPQLEGLYPQLVGNLGSQAPGIEAAATQAGGYYGNMASQADAFHNIMANQGNTNYANEGVLTGAGNSIWNTALDPQSALKAQMQQQVTDASRASTSARGIGTSPEAAGIEDQATSNFLIDWQNQQLSREAQGLQSMTGAYQQAGTQGTLGNQALTGSQAMSGLAPQLLMQGAELPYQTTAGLINQGFTNANTYATALNQDQLSPLSGLMSEIMPYMNYGVGAQGNAFNSGQQNLGNLFSGLGMLNSGANAAAGPGGWMGALAGLFGGGGAAAAGGAAADSGLIDAGITALMFA